MSRFTDKLFGTHSEREIKRIRPLVDRIEGLRPQMQALTDEVRGHNNFAKRMQVVEEQIKVINHRLADLEKGR